MTLGFDRSLGASVDGFMARDAGMFSDSISSAFAILIGSTLYSFSHHSLRTHIISSLLGFYAASNLIQLSENVRPLMTVVSRQIDELDLAALMDISILTKLTNSLYYTLAFCYFLFGNSTQSSFVAAIILILESKGVRVTSHISFSPPLLPLLLIHSLFPFSSLPSSPPSIAVIPGRLGGARV